MSRCGTALSFLVLISACGGRPPDPPPPPGQASLTLGALAADGGFSPLVDGQEVELVPGAQGGIHVWMKLRLRGSPPGHLVASRTARRRTDGGLVLRSTGSLEVGEPDGTGSWDAPAPTPMFMCPSPIGLRVVDESIVFEVTLSSEDGTKVALGSVTLLPRCPASARDFCLRICTG